jgi:hypothetical protein
VLLLLLMLDLLHLRYARVDLVLIRELERLALSDGGAAVVAGVCLWRGTGHLDQCCRCGNAARGDGCSGSSHPLLALTMNTGTPTRG